MEKHTFLVVYKAWRRQAREILAYFPRLILVQARMSDRCYIPAMLFRA